MVYHISLQLWELAQLVFVRRWCTREHSIRRLLTRAGVLRANNKWTSRCWSCRACSDLALSACCTADQRRLLSGRDLGNNTTSRVAPGTPKDEAIRVGLLQGRRPASEGGLKSPDVPWVLAVALQQIREAVLAETRPSGS